MTKCLKILIGLLLVSNLVRSQSTHFIYIQADEKQAFYVKIKEKVFSSSDLGYLTIPHLSEGSQKFTLGFPKNQWPSINYNIEIGDKDLGFQLKKVDSNTWALYDIQTSELVSPYEGNQPQTEILQDNTDDFSNILAEVSNTPSIKQKKKNTDSDDVLVKASEASKVEIAANNPEAINTVTTDQAIKKSEEAIAQPEQKNEEKIDLKTERNSNSVYVPSYIIKEFSYLDSTGRSLTYTVEDGEKKETVILFIPYKSEKPKGRKKSGAQVKKTEAVNQEEPVKTEAAVSVAENSNQPQAPVNTADIKPLESVNKSCLELAGDNDFISLRRMMTQEDTEEKMLATAQKVFTSKCFSTEQVKNLAVLILKDDNRLIFLQIAYQHLSDIHNFSSLVSLLSDEKNISKFKEIQH